jgi:hypothetical protein
MAGLDSNQQAKLRQIIHEHLGSTDVYSRIRSFVREFLENEQGTVLEEDKLLATLHEKVASEFRIVTLFNVNSDPECHPENCRRATFFSWP